MTKLNLHAKDGFTLIEVMISVMIISLVVAALLKMYANNTHIFTMVKKQTDANQYASFLISNRDYGFENKKAHLNDLLGDFDLDYKLRRKLKSIKVTLVYDELHKIDDGEDENANTILRIGKSTIKTKLSSVSLLRLSD